MELATQPGWPGFDSRSLPRVKLKTFNIFNDRFFAKCLAVEAKVTEGVATMNKSQC